ERNSERATRIQERRNGIKRLSSSPMKFISGWVALLCGLALAAGAIDWAQSRAYETEAREQARQGERWRVASDLGFSLEAYRHRSATYRKLTEAEIAQSKQKLRDEVQSGIAQLEEGEPVPEERAQASRLTQQLAEFLALSAKLEPFLYSK